MRALVDGSPPWSSVPLPVPAEVVVRRLTQVHGDQVIPVDRHGPSQLASPGDALVAGAGGSCLVVLTADCAALALGSPEGVYGAVHAGWRGLLAGVVQRAVAAMRALGAGEVSGALGPCIRPCCYEFGPRDLESLVARYGPGLRARTSTGASALDLPAGVRAALAEADARLELDVEQCTGCGPDAFSHRRHGDVGRQAMFVWRRADATWSA